ncbi:hypothetical protein BT96DRAFT_152561 [Gymnopus androsaceus JB14]|uniref:Uncharacterized protein n=1 Tax=Gymnopus androsaceus JB14 TaxID=1447944 RepID=A0A6A4I9L0_9AGAR|nr:hypothetical protein BT96DRAFT_152561 [Gymnopus androsaceus JB14]
MTPWMECQTQTPSPILLLYNSYNNVQTYPSLDSSIPTVCFSLTSSLPFKFYTPRKRQRTIHIIDMSLTGLVFFLSFFALQTYSACGLWFSVY